MHTALSGPNPIPAERLTAEARLDEVARNLAAGLRRILSKQSSSLSAQGGESSFDILALKCRVGRRKPNNRVGG
jgi:hypothetical protein